MSETATVDKTPKVVSTKIPPGWRHLLNAVCDARGEEFPAQTIRALIHDEIERHFPGATT